MIIRSFGQLSAFLSLDLKSKRCERMVTFSIIPKSARKLYENRENVKTMGKSYECNLKFGEEFLICFRDLLKFDTG